MALEVSDIVSSYGSYYLNSGQNKQRILHKLFQSLVLVDYATPIKTDDTIYQMGKAVIGELTQGFQKGFTPKGGVIFTPNEIRQYHIKVDDNIYPDDIEATWLGFLATLPDQERKNWPIVRYLIEEYYLPQINHDLEMKEIYKGEAAAINVGVAGITGKSMNGIRKLLVEGTTTGNMNEIALGKLTTSNIFDKVEEFSDQIDELYQGFPMNICMSKKWRKAYLRDKRAQGYYDMQSDADVNSKVDFTPLDIVGIPGMYGSDVIFATPKQNLIYLTKKDVNRTRILIEEAKREVAFMTDFWMGFGFGLDELVWVAGMGEGSGSGV